MMTDSQALQEARDRWGNDGRVEMVSRKMKSRWQGKSGEDIGVEYRVGINKVLPVWGSVFDVKGFGGTWEDAFRHADDGKSAKEPLN